MTQTFPLAVATAVEQVGPGQYAADAHPEWTVGGRPNGGYLTAIATRAALAASPLPHALATSTHFCASPQPGPLVIDVEVLRSGRSTGQIRARTSQNDLLCTDTVVTVGRLESAVERPSWDRGVPSRSTALYADAVRFHPPADIFPVAMSRQIDIRLEPATLGFASFRPTGLGVIRGWLSLLDGQPFDSLSLQVAVDAFPPATFDVEFTGWVPTLALSTYVRAVPAPGPVQVLHRVHLIADGRADESCHVWDSNGQLVAHATQLAAVRAGSGGSSERA
jgi:hypothetical protein